ncbi:hypothetical protein Plhal304r1_c049g0131641 [Plasmopara halstedii]
MATLTFRIQTMTLEVSVCLTRRLIRRSHRHVPMCNHLQASNNCLRTLDRLLFYYLKTNQRQKSHKFVRRTFPSESSTRQFRQREYGLFGDKTNK